MIIKRRVDSPKLSFKRRLGRIMCSLQYDIRKYKWAIYNFFRSSQHWLIKQIPRSYQDKPELIELLLFAILVDYVETENGLANIDYDWEEELALGHVSKEYVERCGARDKALMDSYNYIKFHRPIMQRQLEKLTELSADIKEYIAYDKLCDEKDQEAMMNIVKYSKYLWT
jgi:hypothetical protein